MADVIKLPLPGGPPQLPAPCGVFAYAGRGNCTAIQVADDSMGQALLFLASAGVIGEVRQTVARGRTTDLEVSVKRRDGTAEFVVLPGDVILFQDDEPEQFTVVTAGMFGALFKTGG